MFSKRKLYAHTTAYTGVNQAAANASQPNNNALAAALTIGQTLKQDGGQVGGSVGGGVRRSTSMQFGKVPAGESYGSMLKRHSITRGGDLASVPGLTRQGKNGMQTPPNSSSQRRLSIRGSVSSRGASVDTSLGSIYENGDSHHNDRRAELSDLSLLRTLSPPSSRTGYNGSSSQLGHHEAPKMVKKYIPTPTGIKIVEVPEDTYNKEVARTNSLRTGGNLSRTGSLTRPKTASLGRSSSFTQGTAKTRSKPTATSLVKPTKLGTMVEKEESVPETKSQKDLEVRKLQQQVEAMRAKSRTLELQLRELEEAKGKKSLKQGNELVPSAPAKQTEKNVGNPEEEEEEEDVPIIKPPVIVDEVEQKRLGLDDSPHKKPDIEKPSLGDVETDNDFSRLEDGAISFVDTLSEDEVMPNNSIDASNVVVDEFEKRWKDDGSASSNNGSMKILDDLKRESGIELGIINQYSESKDLLKNKSQDEESSDLGVEKKENEDSRMAKTLRPKFDNNPKIIDVDTDEGNEKSGLNLQIPISKDRSSSPNSSVRSALSDDSSSASRNAKKPPKSAMKNSASFYNQSSNTPTKKNPAQEAYLSLTTAENTRLNSKLSSTQLNDVPIKQNGVGAPQYQQAPPAFSNYGDNNGKLLSMRGNNPPPPTLSSRTLRPQSSVVSDYASRDSHQYPHQPFAQGMGARSLRDNQTPNQSPYASNIQVGNPAAKAKVSQLYNRASSRPFSFSPAPNPKVNDKENDAKGKKTNPRTTLRDVEFQPPMGTTSQAPTQNQSGAIKTQDKNYFKSRLPDSDEEDGFSRAKGKQIFNEALPAKTGTTSATNGVSGEKRGLGFFAANHTKQQPTATSNGNTLRKQTATNGPRDSKDKKKFSKIRKLFGKN